MVSVLLESSNQATKTLKSKEIYTGIPACQLNKEILLIHPYRQIVWMDKTVLGYCSVKASCARCQNFQTAPGSKLKYLDQNMLGGKWVARLFKELISSSSQ